MSQITAAPIKEKIESEFIDFIWGACVGQFDNLDFYFKTEPTTFELIKIREAIKILNKHGGFK